MHSFGNKTLNWTVTSTSGSKWQSCRGARNCAKLICWNCCSCVPDCSVALSDSILPSNSRRHFPRSFWENLGGWRNLGRHFPARCYQPSTIVICIDMDSFHGRRKSLVCSQHSAGVRNQEQNSVGVYVCGRTQQ